jgi:hypothetical protein
MGDGIYAVGTQIRPGYYSSPGSDGCYWARLSGFSGDLDDIIDNDFSSGGQYVYLQSGDIGFESNGCGTWTWIGN